MVLVWLVQEKLLRYIQVFKSSQFFGQKVLLCKSPSSYLVAYVLYDFLCILYCGISFQYISVWQFIITRVICRKHKYEISLCFVYRSFSGLHFSTTNHVLLVVIHYVEIDYIIVKETNLHCYFVHMSYKYVYMIVCTQLLRHWWCQC